MKLYFKTAPSYCGNVMYLEIDTDSKTYRENILAWDGIKITRREIREIKDAARKDGYKSADA